MNKKLKDEIDVTIKQNNVAKDMFIKKCDNCIKLQKSIDKAIDYIKQDYERNEEIVDYCAFKPFYNNLLKILGGDSLE